MSYATIEEVETSTVEIVVSCPDHGRLLTTSDYEEADDLRWAHNAHHHPESAEGQAWRKTVSQMNERWNVGSNRKEHS